MTNTSTTALSSHTNDPCKANARVFIGNLPTDKVDKATLLTLFNKYGEITAVSLHKGFAFVQYTCEADARDAVNSEHGQQVCGSYIDCKVASEGRSGGFSGSSGSFVSAVQSAPKNRQSALSRFSQPLSRPDSPPSRFHQDHSAYPPPVPKSTSAYSSESSESWGRGGTGSVPSSSVAYGTPSSREAPMSKYQAEIQKERPFDCLVISSDKSLRDFVDYIIGYLKSTAGLSCHVITLPTPMSHCPAYPTVGTGSMAGPHLPPGSSVDHWEARRLVGDVARLGCVPVSVGPVTYTNSVQKSLSVNLHYATTVEEHRHMPLQEAFHLIITSCVQFSLQQRSQLVSPSALVAYPATALSPHQYKQAISKSKGKRRLTRAKDEQTDSTSDKRGAGSISRYKRHYRDRENDSDSPSAAELLGSDENGGSEHDGIARKIKDKLAPPTCKRPAKLHEVIQYILQAVEKTGAEPEVSLEEIDQALYTLQQARAARDSTGTTNNNINSHHEISSISSNCHSANNMPSANTIHVQVATIPTSSTELSTVNVSQQGQCISASGATAVAVSSNTSYVGSATATAVLNATGTAVAYVATPATLVATSTADIDSSSIEGNGPTATVVPSAAAFLHPQTATTYLTTTGPPTQCFIHDSTTGIQYHAQPANPQPHAHLQNNQHNGRA
ncbi:uncharacterized protein LOC134847941 isoform X2 [Symsagittifera roscoffensis]|uniref:uncharacterized protein LOC134847941 isoform X2 n=1 Tax=Symsagittifera roscoffensis TaxID=84072 RepID=UPI00307BD237